MKNLIQLSLLISGLILSASVFSDQKIEYFEQEKLAFSELIPISTELTKNKHYQLHVRRPISYETNPDRYYPTLYILDPYWDFPMVTGLLETMIYDGVLPEMFVVGIGYPGADADHNALRIPDQIPPLHINKDSIKDNEEYQRFAANKFLQFIKQEVIPYVEKRYRANPEFKALAGVSAGGIFTAFAAFEEPSLFQGIISIAGNYGFDSSVFFTKEAQLYAKEKDKNATHLKGRLYFTAAEKEDNPEFIAYAKSLNHVLNAHSYKHFTHKFRLIEGTRHATAKFESYVRGMQWVFKEYLAKQKAENESD